MSWRLNVERHRALFHVAFRKDPPEEEEIDTDNVEELIARREREREESRRFPSLLFNTPYDRRRTEAGRFAAGLAALLGRAEFLPHMLELGRAWSELDDGHASDRDILEAALAESLERSTLNEQRWDALQAHPRTAVRRAAATATPSVERLLIAAADVDPAVRAEARKRLENLGQLPPAWVGLFDGDPGTAVPCDAIEALAVFDRFCRQKDVDNKVAALERLPDELLIHVLPRLVTSLFEYNPLLQKVLEALGRAQPTTAAAQAVVGLVERFANEDSYHIERQVKEAAAAAPTPFRLELCRLLTPWTLEPSNEQRLFERPRFAASVIEASWPPEAGSDRLRELLETLAPGLRPYDEEWGLCHPGTLFFQLLQRKDLEDQLLDIFRSVDAAGWTPPYDRLRKRGEALLFPRFDFEERRRRCLLALESGPTWVRQEAIGHLIADCRDPEADGTIAQLAARLSANPELTDLVESTLAEYLLPQRRAALRAGQLDAEAAIGVVAMIANIYGGGVDLFSHQRASGRSAEMLARLNHPPELAGPPTPEEIETVRKLRDSLIAADGWENGWENSWDDASSLFFDALRAIPAGPLDARDRTFLLSVVGHCPPLSKWLGSRAAHVLVTLSSPSEAAELETLVRALGDRLYASEDNLDDDLYSLRSDLAVLADMGA